MLETSSVDVNWDGQINSEKLMQVPVAEEYEDGICSWSSWSTGDLNGDRDFDSDDLVQAFQAGHDVRSAAVPVDRRPSHSFAVIARHDFQIKHKRELRRAVVTFFYAASTTQAVPFDFQAINFLFESKGTPWSSCRNGHDTKV